MLLHLADSHAFIILCEVSPHIAWQSMNIECNIPQHQRNTYTARIQSGYVWIESAIALIINK